MTDNSLMHPLYYTIAGLHSTHSFHTLSLKIMPYAYSFSG
jgi:hypothetical protein